MSDPQFAAFAAAIADRFAIEGKIGRGSRATVYRGRDLVRDETVAIKVIHPDLAAAIDYGQFLTQMQLTLPISHPGIVPLWEVDQLAGRLVCISPFLEGETLRAHLARERQLSLSDAVGISRHIADALRHTHAHGVIHKDVKPENIFLSGSRALLMDLGLSRAIARSIGLAYTGSGLTLGSPAYMSPEHASGGVELDARTDLYSLGCVFYEMLAGEPPFTGPTRSAVWRSTLTDTPVPITARRNALPSDVGTTIDRLLAKAPAARFPDAERVMEALSTLDA